MAHSRDRVALAVAVVVALAVAVRLVGLGTRPFHWDEARVGYWTLRYADTGVFEYRPVAGGTVLYLLGRWTLAVGASDFLARLPVALVGGLLPAAALLFRDRLRDDEVVLTAVALGFTPLLVHYGRFLRGDVLAAGAALVAVGCLVRWVDRDRDGYLYAGAVAVVVGLASSAFAVATLVLVVAAGALTVDHRRVVGEGETTAAALLRGWEWLVARATPLARALFVFLGAWLVLFWPRGYGLPSNPLAVPQRVFVDPVTAFLAVRVSGREGTEFLPFVTDAASALVATSLPLFAVALGGFLADRYGALPRWAAVDDGDSGAAVSETPAGRPLVAFAGFWAGLGLLGYPVVAEVLAPWTLVHALAPMAIPAGVGLAALVRYGRRALATDDAARAAAALLLLLAVGVHAGVVAADGVYGPQEPGNAFAQYAQPADDLEALGDEMAAAVGSGADDRVVYVGQRFAVPDERALDRPPIASPADREAFGGRLPLPWYVERAGGETESVDGPGALDGEPAVLISDPRHADALAGDVADDGYERHDVRLALWDREVVVFVRI